MIKPLLLAATAIMLVAATVFATMAYMTATATVTNVFTVGNVTLNMFESNVRPDGTKIEDSTLDQSAMKPAKANTYHLMPGLTYTKDPTIYVNAASDKSYLFVKVHNGLKGIESTEADDLTMAQQMSNNGWLKIESHTDGINFVYVYVGADTEEEKAKLRELNAIAEDGARATAAADIKAIEVGGVGVRQDVDVFETFTLTSEITDLTPYRDAKVEITAYAIQSKLDGYEDKIGEQAATADLIETLTVSKSPEGYQLMVQILATAIQAEPITVVENTWGVTVDQNSITLP